MADSRQEELSGRHIGILGGGITGLTAAFYLLRAGARVTIVEARPQLGGLATYFDFGPFWWDKFYHCILTSDGPLLKLIDDLGLSAELLWTETKVGFYTNGALYSMSSTLDFLRFPALSLWAKFRLALGVLRTSRIRESSALESIPVSDWLIRVFGRENYEKMWVPLLKCKLGECREEASAAFIWATISRLYSTRDRNASQKERLGYIRGGYHTVITRLIEEIERMKGRILTGIPVEQLAATSDGGIECVTRGGRMRFDAAIATAPSGIVASLVPSLPSKYLEKLKKIKYLGVVCVVLLLKRKLSPFYCMNLTDDKVPFTGVIEMTNLISLDETRGRHLVYLPKYTPPGDPLFEASDEDVWKLFYPHLIRIVPDLSDDQIERRLVMRERLVQPVPVLRYSDIVPSMETGVPGLLLANTTQIINSTLNNNEMVKIASKAVRQTISDLLTAKITPESEQTASLP